MPRHRGPIESPQTVQGEGQIQPIKPSDVNVSMEEYQNLLSFRVAEEAMQRIKNRVRWPIVIFSIVVVVLAWLEYKSLEPLVRQVMQPHMDAAREHLSNLKIAAGVANEAADLAKSAARKATEKAEEIQESINKLKGQAQGVQVSFETLNQKIESTQLISVQISSRDIEDVRNNLQRLEKLVTDLGQHDSQNIKMLAEYKKVNDEQRKNAEENRAKIAENSGYSVAIMYKSFYIANTHRNIALALSRDGFVYVFIPYQEPINTSLSLLGKKDDLSSSTITLGSQAMQGIQQKSIPKIIYYNSKYESKAREIQSLISPLVKIDTVELASTTYHSSPGLLYSPGLSWQIEISLPDTLY